MESKIFTANTVRNMTMRLALLYIADGKKRVAEYEADVNRWYFHGDGKPRRAGGRGYRYPACIHGTNLWTDYDNICGYCEDGIYPDDRAMNYYRAKADVAEFVKRMEWVLAAPSTLSSEARATINKWACEPVSRFNR